MGRGGRSLFCGVSPGRLVKQGTLLPVLATFNLLLSFYPIPLSCPMVRCLMPTTVQNL